MKKIVLAACMLLVAVSCTRNEFTETLPLSEQQKEVLSKEKVDALISSELQSKGDFDWSAQKAHTIWSALHYGGNLLTVGYVSSGDPKEKNATKTIDNLIQFIRSNESAKSLAKKDSDLHVDETLHYFDIKVTSKETIEALLKDSRVAYIEPAAYKYEESQAYAKSALSSFGCGLEGAELDSKDVRVIEPGALVPWSFDRHFIPQAWDYSTGTGITVAVIDTGLSPEQNLMNENFNTGYSSGRSVEKYGTFVDSDVMDSNEYDGVDDKCGHGTSMTSVATAPRNDDNLPVGVAYNANLVSYRSVEDVYIDDYHEKRGVTEAFKALGDNEDVKIISISVGRLYTIKKVAEAVKYAYNKGKLIVAAGGTSSSFTNWLGVPFPAKMDETLAIGGVNDNQSTTACNNCHKGPEIDFTVQMKRANDNPVPVLSYYSGQADYIEGSSVATAITAGIAALVWSKNPNWTREQVIQKMRESAEFYPNKHPDFGYGNINALKAVQ